MLTGYWPLTSYSDGANLMLKLWTLPLIHDSPNYLSTSTHEKSNHFFVVVKESLRWIWTHIFNYFVSFFLPKSIFSTKFHHIWLFSLQGYDEHI